jgi:hypothetical protein
MALIGLGLIIWAYKRPQTGVRPLPLSAITAGYTLNIRRATRVKRIVFRILLVIPLVIPGDWTQDIPERYGQRHEGITHSMIYPRIHQPNSGS